MPAPTAVAHPPRGANGAPVIECVEVSKTYGGVRALRGVSLALRPGEITALVGDNGAGKSTLVGVLGGMVTPEGGRLIVDGETYGHLTPRQAAALGIEVVYQDLALADNLDVVENMYLGRETLSSFRRLDEARMEKQALETLAELSVTTIKSVRQPVATLSGGQRQSVAVAKSVLWNSKLVILDEPTAALGVAQTRQVLDLVKKLGEQGLAVILISHNMNDVFEVADNITVLRLGHNVGEFKTSDTTQREVVEAITAGKISTVPGMQEEALT
jgi:D-xylose transport system ATP-binding protein